MIGELAPGQTVWDADVKGFGVRCQRQAAVYVLKYRDDIERIVISQTVFEPGASPETHQPGDDADQDAVPGRDESRRRRNRSQASNSARDHAEHGRFSLNRPFEGAPGQRARADATDRRDPAVLLRGRTAQVAARQRQ